MIYFGSDYRVLLDLTLKQVDPDSVSDLDPMRSVDPDPYSGSGSRRTKNTHKGTKL
jgi:hypothetical protein